jgi:hypothetical protein
MSVLNKMNMILFPLHFLRGWSGRKKKKKKENSYSLFDNLYSKVEKQILKSGSREVLPGKMPSRMGREMEEIWNFPMLSSTTIREGGWIGRRK